MLKAVHAGIGWVWLARLTSADYVQKKKQSNPRLFHSFPQAFIDTM